MPPRLGELLLQQQLLDRDELEEALESQVVYGGRLGTNLVELGLVSELDLARTLGRQRRAQYASGEMVPDRRALAFVDAEMADQKEVLPMRVDANRLYVACVDPNDLETFDALAFKSGKRVVPVVIPEFRMNQLLRMHFRAWRPVRPIDMNVTRPSRARLAKVKAQAEAPPPPPPELMDEAEFEALYANMLGKGSPGSMAEAVRAATEPEAAHGAHAPISPAEATEPWTSPLSFGEAQQELLRSHDREAVARTVLRYATGKWARAVLLSVQPPLLTGWRGSGEGVTPDVVRRLMVTLGEDGTFDLVCRTRSHYVGPVRRDEATADFYRTLGGAFPATAVVLPLLVGERVVHVLYVDNGPGAVTPPDIGELLILSQAVNRTYSALLRQRLG